MSNSSLLGASSSTRALLTLSLFLALAALVLALMASSAHAATITVNTTDDELNDDGDCSLREAIIAANTDAARDACPAASGADTIIVPAGTYTLSIAGAYENGGGTGDLDIWTEMTIKGAGARTTIIDGADLDRVFDVATDAEVEIDVELSGLTITNGEAEDNDLGFNEGSGGGVRNLQSRLRLHQVTVSDNTSGVDGGGIYSQGGNLTITDSTVSGNSTSGSGGGVDLVTPPNGLISTIANSTISGNQGGGVLAALPWPHHILEIRSSTIASNTSIQRGGGLKNWGDAGTVDLKNSIVSANTTDNCTGPITSQGNNIDSAATCRFTQPTDKPNTDPLLGPLANNGGPTDTHALLTDSPAIDTGDSTQTTDQRGVSRPQDGDGNATAIDDIGAFEANPDKTAPTVTSTNPTAGAKNVPLSTTAITAIFSEKMKAATLNKGIVKLEKIKGKGRKAKATPVPLSEVSLGEDGKTLTIRPSTPFVKKGVYRVTITTGAEDEAGNALAQNKVWQFKMAKKQ